MKSERLKNFPVVLIMISGSFYIRDIFCFLYGPHITFAHSYTRILYYYKLSVKVKFTIQQATKAQRWNTLSLTSALDGSGWSTPDVICDMI